MTASRWAQPPAPPISLQEANSRLVDLCDELDKQQPVLEALMAEHQRVALRYELEYAAVVQTSEHRSEDRRKAAAVVAMSKIREDGQVMDLATHKAVLEMQIKAAREVCHNIRSQMSSMQTLSANLRSEANLGGGVRL